MTPPLSCAKDILQENGVSGSILNYHRKEIGVPKFSFTKFGKGRGPRFEPCSTPEVVKYVDEKIKQPFPEKSVGKFITFVSSIVEHVVQCVLVKIYQIRILFYAKIMHFFL